MRFGIREICDVVLRAKATQYLGSKKFYKNEPVLYFDTLKTSSLEGASTTVYATGGRGNTRLVAWEGERTLTFTMEDALISPESFSILSGAGLIAVDEDNPIYVHQTSQVEVKADNTIELPDIPCWNKYKTSDENYKAEADIFIMTLDSNGEINDEPCIPAAIDEEDHHIITCYGHHGTIPATTIVLVDYYVKKTGSAQVIEITADKFGGNYYLEASTLFRRQADGVDMPAEFIIPNCKIQSNFTFNMAASGDPSTFTFTMDAFPDYTKFDHTHKVLAALQVITDVTGEDEGSREPCEQYSTTTDGVVNNDYKNTKVTAYGNKPVSDLYRSDVEVQWQPSEDEHTQKGTLVGTFKPITEWKELPHSSGLSPEPAPSEDNPMYFYVISFDEAKYMGNEFKLYKDGEQTNTSEESGKDEMFWVLNVGGHQSFKFELGTEDGQTDTFELDCSQIKKVKA